MSNNRPRRHSVVTLRLTVTADDVFSDVSELPTSTTRRRPLSRNRSSYGRPASRSPTSPLRRAPVPHSSSSPQHRPSPSSGGGSVIPTSPSQPRAPPPLSSSSSSPLFRSPIPSPLQHKSPSSPHPPPSPMRMTPSTSPLSPRQFRYDASATSNNSSRPSGGGWGGGGGGGWGGSGVGGGGGSGGGGWGGSGVGSGGGSGHIPSLVGSISTINSGRICGGSGFGGGGPLSPSSRGASNTSIVTSIGGDRANTSTTTPLARRSSLLTVPGSIIDSGPSDHYLRPPRQRSSSLAGPLQTPDLLR